MTREEFSVIAAALQTYYPRFDLLPNPEAMSLWYRELSDIPYKTLEAALRKWVNTEQWPPTIADLRKVAAETVNGPAPDWGAGYAEVMKAVHKYGVHEPERAKKSLSPITRATIEAIGWEAFCISENPDTMRAQFRQVFELKAKQIEEVERLPPGLKDEIAAIAGSCVKQLGSGINRELPRNGGDSNAVQSTLS